MALNNSWVNWCNILIMYSRFQTKIISKVSVFISYSWILPFFFVQFWCHFYMIMLHDLHQRFNIWTQQLKCIFSKWLFGAYQKGIFYQWMFLLSLTPAGRKVSYENWADGEPSKLFNVFKLEDCAQMRRGSGWQWHDRLCGSANYHYNYICQFRKLK